MPTKAQIECLGLFLLYNCLMNKFIYIIVALVVIFGAIIIGTSKYRETVQVPSVNYENTEGDRAAATSAGEKMTVAAGTYKVDAEDNAEISWSGKKPLILGYVDSGTIPISTGEIVVVGDGTEASASGAFTFSVKDLKVGLIAKKPGQEGGLERHLKSDAFFNVETHPTASFTVKNVSKIPRVTADVSGSDISDDFMYTITGDLRIKDITQEISFPAEIYSKIGANAEGSAVTELHLKADTQIDRTKWGMTFASGNFFQNLGDNLVDDMVDISVHLVMQEMVGLDTATE